MSELTQVLGVDCAAAESMVFDGTKFKKRKPWKLDKELTGYVDGPALICWDAPLTGPASVDPIDSTPGAYSMRPIERFCNRQRKHTPICGEFDGVDQVPVGINTQGYTGVSHWAVTQALTGHPRVSRYHGTPRFELLVDSDPCALSPVEVTGTKLVEVHPAVALWLWLYPELDESERQQKDFFQYKSNRRVDTDQGDSPQGTSGSKGGAKVRTQKLTRRLLKVLDGLVADHPSRAAGGGDDLVYGSRSKQDLINKIDGDHNKLDAYVAWVLGRLALHSDGEVILLGCAQTGAFLLPHSDQLVDAWQSHLSKEGHPCACGREGGPVAL